MARKVKHPEHVNHERWLVSYADFITLLFAFFTVLYATSQTDVKKTQQFVGSVERAFSLTIFEPGSNEVLLNTNIGGGAQAVYDMGITLAELEHNIGDALRNDPMLENATIQNTPEGLLITLETVSFFKPGSDQIQIKARQMIEKICVQLNKTANLIQISGHTDNIPFRNIIFGSNWELSSARAMSVLRIMLDNNVSDKRMMVSAFADNHPVASNATETGRAKNRRVEILIMPKKVEDSVVIKPGPLADELMQTFSEPAIKEIPK